MQEFTSAGTSLNQVPGAWNLIHDKVDDTFSFKISRLLDYGGGKYDKFTDQLAYCNIENFVLDPYNRTMTHNTLVRKALEQQPADAAICANVLNVIKEPAVRQEALEIIRELTKIGGQVFFTVHEGNKTSRGRRSKDDCWQANRPTKNYLREIKKVFPGATRKGKLIIATRGE